MTYRPIRTRFRFGCSIFCLNLPRPVSRRLILQQAHGQTLNRPPIACKLTVSCSISLPFRGSFHLSLAVLCTIGHAGVFSLTRWSSWIHTGFHVPRATRDAARFLKLSTTGLSPSLVQLSTASSSRQIPRRCPTTPAIKIAGLGSFHFARRYYGNRGFFLFLQLLRCFSSLRSLAPSYRFRWPYLGLPHSETSGSMHASCSPEHIVGSHVLHRLCVPRYPP